MLDRHGRDLVYGVGMSLSRAVVTSLLVVGVTSAFAAVPRLAHREVKWRIAGVFGGAGIPAAFGGAAINRLVSPRLLLVGFVALMLLAAWRMLQEDEEVGEVSRNAPHRISSRTFSRLISVQPTYLTVVLDRSAVTACLQLPPGRTAPARAC